MRPDRQTIFLSIIIAVTLTVFFPTIRNGFTNWDDGYHVVNNPDITSLSFQNISKIFSSFYLAHYIPLVILSFAVEFAFFGLDPFVFHFTNLFLHLITTVLIFTLVKQWKFNDNVAFIAALLFGIHPLHVEPVAWISARKDVLSSVFLIGSLLLYYRHRETLVKKYYWFALSMYLLSLLSKASGMFLPFFLLVELMTKGESINGKFVRLTPFFFVSLFFAALVVYSHHASSALHFGEKFTMVESLCNSGYAVLFYVVKTVLPINLSSVYPYPARINGMLPLVFYIAPGVILLSGAVVLYFRKKFLVYSVPLCFFMFGLLPTLQLISFGSVFAADRFVYLPLVGLLVIIISALERILPPRDNSTMIAKTAVTIIVIIFSVTTWDRVLVWKNSETLWTDAISRYPEFPISYFSRGQYYFSKNNFDKAFVDFDKAIALAPYYPDALNMRGYLYAVDGKNSEARADFNRVIGLKPEFAIAYYNRGLISVQEGMNDSAIVDFSKAIEYDTSMIEAYNQRGSLLLSKKRFKEAYFDYSHVIRFQPLNAQAYANRGSAVMNLEQYDLALQDFHTALKIDPVLYVVKLQIALLYHARGEKDSARYYLHRAEQEGIKIPDEIRKNIFKN